MRDEREGMECEGEGGEGWEGGKGRGGRGRGRMRGSGRDEREWER